MAPEAQREVQERVDRTVRHLDEIRRARGMTQVTLASAMGVSQAQITKIEQRLAATPELFKTYVISSTCY